VIRGAGDARSARVRGESAQTGKADAPDGAVRCRVIPEARRGEIMTGRIRLPLVLGVIAGACAVSALTVGAYWRGIESGRAEWRFAAARRGADVRVYRDTSSALLRELVTRDMSLREPGLTDWETVNRLRDWSARNLDLATESLLLDRDPSFEFYNRSAGEIFAAFFQDRGGVWCGGSAYALMEVYRLFGFQASFLDYGEPSALTHVVTLVKIRHDGVEKTVVQDPTFNIAYAAQGGVPLDLMELLGMLMRHQHERVRLVRGGRAGGEVLVHPNDGAFPFDHVVDPDSRLLRVLGNGVKKYQSQLSLERVERQFGERIRSALRKRGHPGNMLYLFLYPLAGSDQALVDAAKRMTGRS
jgi:hypothetical protein